MDRLNNIMLRRYDNEDFVVKERVFILYSVCAVLFLLSLFTLLANVIIPEHMPFSVSSSVLRMGILAVGFFAIFFGRYVIVSILLPVILVLSFWGELFYYGNSISVTLFQLLVFPSLIGVGMFMMIRQRRIMTTYYIINMILVLIFARVYGPNLFSSYAEGLSFSFSMELSLGLAWLLSYQFVHFNRHVLDKARMAELEIQAQNAQLRAANDEFEQINADLELSQSQLLESEAKYRTIYENALVGMFSVREEDGIIFDANDMGANLLGFSHVSKAEEGVLFSDLFVDIDVYRKLMIELNQSTEVYGVEAKMLKQDGSIGWLIVTGRKCSNHHVYEFVVADITKRKIAEENVYKLTFYDSLTDLPNRRMFMKSLDTAVMKSLRKIGGHYFAVMCLGIDQFKHINQRMSAHAGDQLLRMIGRRLIDSVRGDDMVSRFDGDKFMILFSEIGNPDNILRIARKTWEILNQPFILEGRRIYVSSCRGLAIFPNDGIDAEEIIRNAERAMYNAKQCGPDSYQLFDAQFNDTLLEQLQLEEELRDAIRRDELVPYFQPKVDRNEALVGVEALVRWNSPSRGLLLPGRFIPLAEKNGMIVEIGKIILYKSCLAGKTWLDQGLDPLPISVNFSPIQFRQRYLVKDIEEVLRVTGFPAELLEVEITESGIMEDEQDSIDKLNELHQLGVKISIDDFGTGYSSLSKLKDYPIDTLKIDKSFIDNILLDNRSAKIATAIIDLAHNLGYQVVAEGIESSSQADFLSTLLCDHFQGFYFSKPLDGQTLEKEVLNRDGSKEVSISLF